MVRAAAFVAALYLVGSVPPDVSLATLAACERHNVDCVALGAYLVSEHGDDWTDEPSACSSKGACGPFQLSKLWPRHFGYAVDDRACPWASADMAAQLVAYSQERAIETRSPHDWRARMKCKPGQRHRCAGPVAGWRRTEQRICAIVGGLLRECREETWLDS